MEIVDASYCAVDIETTGLDTARDEIIAVACVPIRSLRILVHRAFFTLVRAGTYRIASMKYHGISPGDLEAAPPFEDVAPEIFRLTEGILVGYAVAFDYAFLQREFRRVGMKLKRDLVDVAAIEDWLRQKNGDPPMDLSLESMLRTYEIRPRFRHHAMADAFFAAQIFQIQVPKLLRLGIHKTGKLRRIARRRGGDGTAFVY
ncbi:MAG: 3'-5' exonuclease [Deltaproteobacteria bacterium]|nr:3'-5' exonuclease [Deltaproteobacteria bacterium]